MGCPDSQEPDGYPDRYVYEAAQLRGITSGGRAGLRDRRTHKGHEGKKNQPDGGKRESCNVTGNSRRRKFEKGVWDEFPKKRLWSEPDATGDQTK